MAKDAKPGRIPGMATKALANPGTSAGASGAAYPVQPFSALQFQSRGQITPPGQPVLTAQPAQPAEAASPTPQHSDSPDDWRSIPPNAREELWWIWRNPKNRIYYDFFRQKFPQFDGDFADFVGDAIESLLKNLCYGLVVRKTR